MNERVYKRVAAKLVFQMVLTSWVSDLEKGIHSGRKTHAEFYTCIGIVVSTNVRWVGLICCRSEKGDLEQIVNGA